MAESTAKHRTVSILSADADDNDGVPVSKTVHERSGEFAKALLGQLDEVVSDRLDAAIKPALEEGLTQLFDRFATEISPNSTTTVGVAPSLRPPILPWVIVGVLAAVTIAGAWFATWDKLVGLVERQSRLEEAQSDDDAYDRSVAHYLVLKASNDYSNVERQDKMLRAVAEEVGAKVDHIPPPKQSDPPTTVQEKNREFKAARGE